MSEINDIKERIKKIETYFKTMQVIQAVSDDNSMHTIIYIDVSFPANWSVPSDIEQKYNVSVVINRDGDFIFACEISNGFDKIFDAIDETINKMLIAEEKVRLLNSKIKELKELFSDEAIPIEKLRDLKIEVSNNSNKKEIIEK